MKRNKTVKTTMLLMIAVLMTLSLVSGSMAKFIHTTQGSDIARVAQFELVVQSYDQRGGESSATVWGSPETKINLLSTTTDDSGIFNDPTTGFDTNNNMKLIAPGSSGQFNINVSNKSEVPVRPTFAINEAFFNDKKIPIVYGYNTYFYSNYCLPGLSVGGKHITGSLEDLSEELSLSVGNLAPSNASSSVNAQTQTIAWSWAFNAEDNQTSASDTLLAVDSSLTSLDQPTITLTLACTAEQLDTYPVG